MEWARVVDSFREVAPLAEKKGVLLCIENHSSVAHDADSLLWIIREIGSPTMRTNPDCLNFCPGYNTRTAEEKEVIYTSTAKLLPLAVNLHLKIRDFTPKGEHANLDLLRLAEILRKARYRGPVSLEYHGVDDPRKPNELGMKLLRKYFA